RGRGRRRWRRERLQRLGLPVPAALRVELPGAARGDAITFVGGELAEREVDPERAVALGVVDEPDVRRRGRAAIGRDGAIGRDAAVGGHATVGRDATAGGSWRRSRRRGRDEDDRTNPAIDDALLAAPREQLGAIDDRLPRRDRAELGDLLARIRGGVGLVGRRRLGGAGAGPGAGGVGARAGSRRAGPRRASVPRAALLRGRVGGTIAGRGPLARSPALARPARGDRGARGDHQHPGGGAAHAHHDRAPSSSAIGATISLREPASHTMYPGNGSTSGTTTVRRAAAAVPYTPRSR